MRLWTRSGNTTRPRRVVSDVQRRDDLVKPVNRQLGHGVQVPLLGSGQQDRLGARREVARSSYSSQKDTRFLPALSPTVRDQSAMTTGTRHGTQSASATNLTGHTWHRGLNHPSVSQADSKEIARQAYLAHEDGLKVLDRSRRRSQRPSGDQRSCRSPHLSKEPASPDHGAMAITWTS